MTDACPTTSAHDFVVMEMWGDSDHRCIYSVKCAECGITDHGYHGEIPPARFDTQTAKDLRE